jgi:hypothetical protein
MTDEGVYLFCFCRPGATLAPLVGLDDASPVEERVLGSVAAVCCRVPLADFSGAQAEERFRDPAWLVERAFAHGRVIEKVRTRSPVLPLHFGTIFNNDGGLIELLSRHHGTITRFLDEMVDRHEWAVQAFLDISRAEDWLLINDPELAEQHRRLPDSPGTRYFREKKLRLEARNRTEQLGRRLAEQLREQISALGLPTVMLPARKPDETGQEMIFHAVCLIPGNRVEGAQARIEEIGAACQKLGATLKTSGPWPPYHFCPALEEKA